MKDKLKSKVYKYNTETFINKAKNIHGDKYDYSKTEYINSTTKIIIICNIHGEFLAYPNTHLQGVCCAKCSFDRKKITQNEYIDKCKLYHGDKYDYSKTEYNGWNKNVTLTCLEHGDFNIRANYISVRGCQKCGFKKLSDSHKKTTHKSKYYKGNINYKPKKVYTTSDFKIDSINKHNDRYDYSLVDFKNKKTKVQIICDVHGIFEQIPYRHVIGAGCPKCVNKKSQYQFIKECNEKHNYEYDYSLVKYFNCTQNIKIICKVHGEFKQNAEHHLRGCKCPKCQGCFKDIKLFIEQSNDIHSNRYDYSIAEYVNNRTKVKIICEKHGVFEQIPKHHLKGSGCPLCTNNSKGENSIVRLLNNKNIKYIRQKTFDDCSSIVKKLQFDFYLQEYNICIEYDGIQHYESVEWFGGDVSFEKQNHRDNIKNEYCQKNNISLIRIRYDENIEDKLSFLF